MEKESKFFYDKKLKMFKESFNFQVDGCLRENCFEDGKYWSSYIISLIKNDYVKSKNGR